MSLFSATAMYYQAPAEPAAAGYIIRPDAYSAYISFATPMNYFSGSFGMTSYLSDIHASIKGSGTNYTFASTGSSPTGTIRANALTPFTANGYNTSVILSGIAYPFANGTTTRPTDMTMSNSNFVIEGYVNFPVAPTGNGISFIGQYSDMNITMNQSPSYIRFLVGPGDIFADSATSITKPTNTWIHFAFVRSGNTFNGYWSGSRVLTFSNTLTIGNTAVATYLGYAGNSLVTASYQDFRIYKGTDKGYTGTTVTAPLSMVTTA